HTGLNSYTHSYTHTHTHTRIYTHSHKHTHTFTHTHTHTHTHTYIYTDIQTYIKHTYTYTYIHTYIHTSLHNLIALSSLLLTITAVLVCTSSLFHIHCSHSVFLSLFLTPSAGLPSKPPHINSTPSLCFGV